MRKLRVAVLFWVLCSSSFVACDGAISSYQDGDSSSPSFSLTSQSSADEDSSEQKSSLDFSSDPYINVSFTDFYEDYSEASCYLDSYYRSLHGLMSGSIEDQEQIPDYLINSPSAYYEYGDKTASNPYNQPMEDGLFVSNASYFYSDEGKSYRVIDKDGKTVKTIYEGGGYVTLEDVAAYLLAFGETPANYVDGKTPDPSSSIWGIYLRANNTYFSGRTSYKYVYEPDFPGNDGAYCPDEPYIDRKMKYYEIDVGTTGCNYYSNGYKAAIYNNGTNITRGASRICYTRYYEDGEEIKDPSKRYVFYTYDHYNDFQEYLGYYQGFGKWFGNLAGGGSYCNSTHAYTTSYPLTCSKELA